VLLDRRPAVAVALRNASQEGIVGACS